MLRPLIMAIFMLYMKMYVENTLYSTNKYSCVRPVHTLYSSYLIEHKGDDELHDSQYTSLYIPTYTCVVFVTQCTSY